MLDLIKGISPEETAAAVNGKLLFLGNKKITGASIDSRSIKDGDLFVAIKGEKTDGHCYIDAASQAGAAAVLVENSDISIKLPQKNNCSVILVNNTVLALGKLAKKHKEELNTLTVAVTGSVGKTTTRQFIYAVLSSEMKTHKTEGNFK